MVNTYIRAPNWSTAPPPDGPLKLGHLLDNLDEFVPINRDAIVKVTNENPVDTKEGFTMTLGKTTTCEIGIFAKFLEMTSIGLNVGVHYEIDSNIILSFDKFDTITFDPTLDYIQKSIELDPVKSFMTNSSYKKPVYMVTGLKVGRQGSMNTSSTTKQGGELDVGVNPPSAPIEVGPKFDLNNTTSEGQSYKKSTDFIVAFRVRRIRYRKGQLEQEAYNKRAEMQDDDDLTDNKTGLFLEMSDDISTVDFPDSSSVWEERGKDDGDAEETLWMIPREE